MAASKIKRIGDLKHNPQSPHVTSTKNPETFNSSSRLGVKNDHDAKAAYIHWACTAPQNNKHDFGVQKYEGVGGHLVAIAVEKSLEWGYDGVIHGFAANKELVQHYEEKFNAKLIAMLHPYQVVIEAEDAKKLLEVYTYEWN